MVGVMQRKLLTTSHKQTDDQPVSEQWSPRKTSPCHTHSFIADRDVIWQGISLSSVGVSCPGCVHAQHLAHTSCLIEEWDGVRNGESLEAVHTLVTKPKHSTIGAASS